MRRDVGRFGMEPYPGAKTRWDYFQALHTSDKLETAGGDLPRIVSILTRYIFGKHSDVLDLAPSVCYRYRQAQRIAGTHHNGESALAESILGHFLAAEHTLQKGYTRMSTPTLISSDQARPRPEIVNEELTQKVALPASILRRSLAWNHWVQNKINAGEIDELFCSSPLWHGIRPAEGTILPVGNLNIELVEGLARARTRAHLARDVERQWGLPTTDEWGSGLDLWFAMTHIIEKDLLRLTASIDPNMVDGMRLTPEVYAKSYIPILELMDLNPQLAIQGVLSEGTWAYSSELARLFPDQHISKLHAIAGKVIELGSAEELGLPEQATFATYDPTRKKAYQEGLYKANVAARFIDRAGMEAIIRQFGLNNQE